jgi:hypothetical protein
MAIRQSRTALLRTQVITIRRNTGKSVGGKHSILRYIVNGIFVSRESVPIFALAKIDLNIKP